MPLLLLFLDIWGFLVEIMLSNQLWCLPAMTYTDIFSEQIHTLDLEMFCPLDLFQEIKQIISSVVGQILQVIKLQGKIIAVR